MSETNEPPQVRCEHCDQLISVNASKCIHCGESVRSLKRAKYEFYLWVFAIPVNLLVGYLLAFRWEQMGVWTRPVALGLFVLVWYLLYTSYRSYNRRREAVQT